MRHRHGGWERVGEGGRTKGDNCVSGVGERAAVCCMAMYVCARPHRVGHRLLIYLTIESKSVLKKLECT